MIPVKSIQKRVELHDKDDKHSWKRFIGAGLGLTRDTNEKQQII